MHASNNKRCNYNMFNVNVLSKYRFNEDWSAQHH